MCWGLILACVRQYLGTWQKKGVRANQNYLIGEGRWSLQRIYVDSSHPDPPPLLMPNKQARPVYSPGHHNSSLNIFLYTILPLTLPA